MATLLENLQARKEAIGVELAAMGPTKAGGLPDATKSGVGHVAYRMSLLEELKQLNDTINQEQINAQQDAGGYEFLSIGQ